MKIYTRGGDKGKTAIIGGRVDKDDLRIEAFGTIDELNCFVGQASALPEKEVGSHLREHLIAIQHELFDCGSDLSYKDAGSDKWKVTADQVEQLEQWIDQYTLETPSLRRFILPGGTGLSSLLHVCRGVCRRAERRTVSLSKAADVNPQVLRYLNRLSDLFFTVARAANARTGVNDIEYVRSADVFKDR